MGAETCLVVASGDTQLVIAVQDRTALRPGGANRFYAGLSQNQPV